MRQWGYRAEATVAHIRKFAGEAKGQFADALQEALVGTLSRDSLLVLQHVLEEEYSRAKRHSEQARLKAWKSRLQSSERQCYKWIQGAKAQTPAPMKTRSGGYTVDRNFQLEETLEEWLPIFHKFKVDKPDVASFTTHFGQFLKSSPMSLSLLTGADLVNAARATSPSAASLDSWRPTAITALALWFPMLFEDLAMILNKVEELGEWPQDLLSSYTSLIPKDEHADDVSATDFRPITVLSAIYWLYVKARFAALLQWQESWVSEAIFGCRKGKSAETLAMQIAMDLESKGYTRFQYMAEVSYDCRKAFDLVPIEIALECMRLRGCQPHILSALHGLYNGLHRVFRLHGVVGNWWYSYNGLVQGDLISMVILNSLVTCVVEASARLPYPALRTSTYADDISAVIRGETLQEVKNGLRAVHAVVCGYVSSGCGELNDRKCFTFGDEYVKGLLHPGFQHLEDFRIVGGSLVVRDDASFVTQLEQKRWDKWKGSIRRVRHVPLGWKQRARMMLAMQSQATFGQGTHGLVENVDYLKKVRSEIMRALWKADFYSCSPLVTMALLVPVQLDPEFGAIYDGLRTVMRFMRDPVTATEMSRRFALTPQCLVDGPTARLRVLADGSVLAPHIRRLLQRNTFCEDEWLHDLRETWRSHLWARVS